MKRHDIGCGLSTYWNRRGHRRPRDAPPGSQLRWIPVVPTVWAWVKTTFMWTFSQHNSWIVRGIVVAIVLGEKRLFCSRRPTCASVITRDFQGGKLEIVFWMFWRDTGMPTSWSSFSTGPYRLAICRYPLRTGVAVHAQTIADAFCLNGTISADVQFALCLVLGNLLNKGFLRYD